MNFMSNLHLKGIHAVRLNFFVYIKEALATILTQTIICAVNKRQHTNYSFVLVTSKVSCIRRKRGQIICWQGNNKSMVIFVLKRRKVV
jgi:histidinol phosphatase-like enzyme